MIQALLVDDEESANSWLAKLLSQFSSVQVVGTATSVTRAEALLKELEVNTVFLDIEMPRRRGVELFAELNKNIRVVMVTSHNNHALDAYELGALDYLLKPVTIKRLTLTVERLIDSLPGQVTPLLDENAQRIQLSSNHGTILLDLDQILWIEARENYSLVHLVQTEPVFIRRSLSEWEQSLVASAFARIDRSTLIHLRRIQSVQWRMPEDSLLSFTGATQQLLLGRSAAKRLKQFLGEFNARP